MFQKGFSVWDDVESLLACVYSPQPARPAFFWDLYFCKLLFFSESDFFGSLAENIGTTRMRFDRQSAMSYLHQFLSFSPSDARSHLLHFRKTFSMITKLSAFRQSIGKLRKLAKILEQSPRFHLPDFNLLVKFLAQTLDIFLRVNFDDSVKMFSAIFPKSQRGQLLHSIQGHSALISKLFRLAWFDLNSVDLRLLDLITKVSVDEALILPILANPTIDSKTLELILHKTQSNFGLFCYFARIGLVSDSLHFLSLFCIQIRCRSPQRRAHVKLAFQVLSANALFLGSVGNVQVNFMRRF